MLTEPLEQIELRAHEVGRLGPGAVGLAVEPDLRPSTKMGWCNAGATAGKRIAVAQDSGHQDAPGRALRGRRDKRVVRRDRASS